MSFDVIRTIEACYAPAASDEAWLRGMAETLAPVAPWYGSFGATFEVGAEIRVLSMGIDGPMPDNWREVASTAQKLPPEFFAPAFRPGLYIASRRLLPCVGIPSRLPMVRRVWEEFRAAMMAKPGGTTEGFGVIAAGPGGRGVLVEYPVPEGHVQGPRLWHQLGHVLRHLDAAHRLRLASGDAGPDSLSTDAVLDPSGRVVHGTPRAITRDARQSLGAAARRMERARGPLRRIAPEEALALWSALLEGVWTLVEHVDSDGRRFILARRNPPGVRDPKALGPRERQAAELAAQGLSYKRIGFELGISPSTAFDYLRSAQRKLGVRSRRELIELLAVWRRGSDVPPSAGIVSQ